MNPKNRIYDHILPDLKDWPITKFSEDRDNFIQRHIDFVLTKLVQSKLPVSELLNKTVYLEKIRVKKFPWKVDPSDAKDFWNTLEVELRKTKDADNPEKERIKILRRIVHRYSEEIIGHFVPKTHLFARKILTAFFKRLYNNGWGKNHKGIWGSREDLYSKIKVDGKIEELRALFSKGTVVIVPTHYTNLDSILIAFGIDRKVGVPAFSYGAGLNLYDTELLAYYMNRLGAYRVDRRKKNPVYLETLKSMASLSLIEGLNHIFFPGGTRSRSGAIEEKLKLGLLNSVIDAQRHCILNNIEQKLFVVPLAVGYHFILEADSLINQYLKTQGKERFVKSKKKSSTIRNLLTFIRRLRKKDSEVYLSFGQPMDVLGNVVDIEGNSYDPRGNKIDIKSYFSAGEKQNIDQQRESIYTRILADKIVDGFKEENIVLSSHFVSYVAFKYISELDPEADLFDTLKREPKKIKIDKSKFLEWITFYQRELKKLSADGKAKLSEDLTLNPEALLEKGISKVGVYHKNKVLKLRNNQFVETEDLKLLYYYHNKLVHYDLPSYTSNDLVKAV